MIIFSFIGFEGGSGACAHTYGRIHTLHHKAPTILG